MEQEQAQQARVKREEDDSVAERKKSKKGQSGRKRSAGEMEVDGEGEEVADRGDSLPSVGAHGLARQDGVGVHEGMLTTIFAFGHSLRFPVAH